jgi:hypothetical protein
MLTTPLAFDCSANKISSALLEKLCCQYYCCASRAKHIPGIWQLYRMCPWRVLHLHWSVTVKTKDVWGAVYVTEINPHSLNYGLRMSSPLPGIANGPSRASNTLFLISLFARQKTLVLEGMASDLSAALCCGLVQYLPPPSWNGSADLLIEVSVESE